MAGNKNKGTKLKVTRGKAARANLAIFDALAKASPQDIKQLQKRLKKYKGLDEIYYASLTKRLHALETGYVAKAKQPQGEAKGQAKYELKTKAYLAMLLNEHSIQEIIDKATDTGAALILLAFLYALLSKEDEEG